MLLFLFVDDMQAGFNEADEARAGARSTQQLKHRFNITDLGESKFMLGMRITRDRQREDDQAWIRSSTSRKALEKFGTAALHASVARQASPTKPSCDG